MKYDVLIQWAGPDGEFGFAAQEATTEADDAAHAARKVRDQLLDEGVEGRGFRVGVYAEGTTAPLLASVRSHYGAIPVISRNRYAEQEAGR